MTEARIAAAVVFSEAGYTTDKITYATGTYEGWDAFVADHQPVMEEEYPTMKKAMPAIAAYIYLRKYGFNRQNT